MKMCQTFSSTHQSMKELVGYYNDSKKKKTSKPTN